MPDSTPTPECRAAGPADEDTATAPLLQAEQLSCRYAGHTALEDFSLTVYPGEVVGLLGPNGAGKSTALKLLAGVMPPSDGRVRLAGRDLLDRGLRYRRQLGYLPERPPLYPEMRVRAYLRFCARLRHTPQAAAAVDTALAECGLESVAGRRLDQLSQGYRQRVGIAQAIVHRPALIVLDEPTVGLDPLQLQGIRTLIRRLRGEHAIILSSHILPEIQALADRVVILNRGRICHQGPTHTDADWISARFRDRPDASALGGLPGIAQAKPLTGDHWQIRLSPGTAPEAVLAEVAAQDWGLLAWQPGGDALEQIFLKATEGTGDTP